MQQVTGSRVDPAPSRLNYRMQRLLLTPIFRLVLRVGVPFMLGFGGLTLWFSDEERRDAFNLLISDLQAEIEQRPEFMVKIMAIDGASVGVSEDIRAILHLDFPISSFDLDLDEMRATVAELDAVETARMRIRQGGVLQIDVVERTPAVLWRSIQGLELLDASGVHVRTVAQRSAFPDLPVVAGEGANDAIPEALELIATSGPLMMRLRGMERIGARRWDVVLDRNQRIMLPETGALQALQRVIAMDQVPDMQILARDVVAVDLRLPDRPTLRMTHHALDEYRRIKTLESEEGRL